MFVQDFAGLEINEKIQLQFCERIPKLSCNLEKLLKMANDRKNATAPVFNTCLKEVTWQLNYATIKVSSD